MNDQPLILLCLGMTYMAFHFKSQMLMILSVGPWFIYGTYSYSQSATTWDTPYALFIFCVFGMTFSLMLEFIFMERSRREKTEEARIEEIASHAAETFDGEGIAGIRKRMKAFRFPGMEDVK